MLYFQKKKEREEKKKHIWIKKYIHARYKYITVTPNCKLLFTEINVSVVAVLLRIKIYRFFTQRYTRTKHFFIYLSSLLRRIVERIYPRRESGTKQIWIWRGGGGRGSVYDNHQFRKNKQLGQFQAPDTSGLLRSN